MYICAVDVGTTAVKSILVDKSGNKLAYFSANYPLITASGGIVEQDACKWKELVIQTVRECTGSIAPKEVACICISAQGGSLVPVDEKGDPLAYAATWMDKRNKAFFSEFSQGERDDRWFHSRTGRRLSPGSCIGNFLEFKKYEPAHYLTTLEYLNMQLTGIPITDPTSAAMTGMLDIHSSGWQNEILELCGIRESALPEIMPTGTVIGNLTPEAAEAMGLTTNTKVVNGGHDQYCAAAGANVLEAGDILLSTGTAWVIFGATRFLNHDSILSVGPHVCPNMYGVFSSVPTGGAALDWVRNKLFGDSQLSFDVLDNEVMKRIGINENIFLRPNFSNGKASIEGLDLHSDAYDIALAAMEGVVFEVRRIMERFVAEGHIVQSVKLIGGASKAAPWQKLICSIIGDVQLFHDTDIACLGAAALGGVAVGIWSDLKEASKILSSSELLARDTIESEYYEKKYLRYSK